jgi:hypothetical protein
MQTTTHHHDDGAAFHTNFHAINNSQPHDNVAATIDLNDHNALTNLWAQRIFTEEELSTLLESSLDIDIEPQYDALTQQLNAINRKLWDVYRVSKEPWTGDPAEEGRMRIGDTGEWLVIQWISKGWTTHELQLPVFYRETLGRLLALEKFQNLIETNIEAGITLYTDHKPALFENSLSNKGQLSA